MQTIERHQARNPQSQDRGSAAPKWAIGIIAWNEEAAIGAALESLFSQSCFAELARRQGHCEIICLANGCTDRTPVIAAEVFSRHEAGHPYRSTFTCRPLDLQERGKINAWNLFVHTLAPASAQVLFLMDGDIVIHHPATLWNLYEALQANPQAAIAVDQPLKDIALKPRKSLRERFSLATSAMSQTGAAQLSGQLYAIRAEVARRILLPRDLAACEDGFIKSIVCTDFLTRELRPQRMVQAEPASHVFESYLSLGDILRNQKRQMIGQTIVHLLVDGRLRQLSPAEKLDLAGTLKAWEAADPLWLKRLIGDHIRRTAHPWQLFPGILQFRFKRLAKLPGFRKATNLPVALGGFFVTLIACWLARRFLRQGYVNYWPDTKSPNLKGLNPGAAAQPAPYAT